MTVARSGARGAEEIVVALTVAYDGAPFAGFARQPGCDTVQGRLESALTTLLRRDVAVVGAGRTDAGVHALGQVVSFPASVGEIDAEALRRGVEALSGEAVSVREVRLAPSDFDARHSASGREYRYRLALGPSAPVFTRRYSWSYSRPLDLQAMRAAAAHLVGEHDFTSFCVKASAGSARTVRTLDTLDIAEESHLGEPSLVLRLAARSFLHSMVRIIVGTLVEVGAGRRGPGWVTEVLAARAREAAGPTAPARGLTLWRVRYPEGIWLDDGYARPR